jgi:hypothetical protein
MYRFQDDFLMLKEKTEERESSISFSLEVNK